MTPAHSRTDAILDATVELLAEVGYDQLTMDAIATRAHASKATIYRRWRDKAQMVVASLSRISATMPAETDTGGLREDLVEMLLRQRDSLAEKDGALVLGVINAMRSNAELAEVVRERLLGTKTSTLAAVTARAVARNELPHNSNHVLAAEIASAVVFTRLLVTGLPLERTDALNLVDGALIPVLKLPSNTS